MREVQLLAARDIITIAHQQKIFKNIQYNYHKIIMRKLRYSLNTEDFKTLGLKKNASSREIKLAYYSLAKDLHPDTKTVKESNSSFVEINEAYKRLLYYDTFGKSCDSGRNLNQPGWYGWDPVQSYYSKTRVTLRKINIAIRISLLILFAIVILRKTLHDLKILVK